MKKQTFLTVDIESTMNDKAADFAAVLSDRKGNIISTCAVLVRGIFDDKENNPLFHSNKAVGLWLAQNLEARYEAYYAMLDNGARMFSNIGGVNNWLMTAKAQYDPVLTAYNLAFDTRIARNTGINLECFHKRFCLWQGCVSAFAYTRKYREFILAHHLFKPRTKHGNMTIPTNADVMARFVLGNVEIPKEPHLALEDILGYEKPILDKLLKVKTTKWLLNNQVAFNWRDFIVRDLYKSR